MFYQSDFPGFIIEDSLVLSRGSWKLTTLDTSTFHSPKRNVMAFFMHPGGPTEFTPLYGLNSGSAN